MTATGTSRPLTLDSLRVVCLRNLRLVEIEPSPRVNVITGDNGQGKTSILEAIYLLATSRSFRTAKLTEVVQHDATIGSVRGQLTERGPGYPIQHEQSVGIEGGRRHVKLDGKRPISLAHFAIQVPVVVFEPRQMALSSGPASERRTLLDRVMMFSDPGIAAHRASYVKALRGRQRLLADRFPRLRDCLELNAYEALMAEHGAALTEARAAAVRALATDIELSFARIGAPELLLGVGYEPGGSADVDIARRELCDARFSDAQRKRTAFGPHRDDIALSLDGHPARIVGSQGQHRAITLALKSAELACISRARGLQPLLLLDDVSSELDPERTAALFDHLAATESQLFLTTTRSDLIVTGDQRRDFRVSAGVVERA